MIDSPRKADPALNTVCGATSPRDSRGVLLFITAAGADAIGVGPEAVRYAFNEGTNSAGEPAADAPTSADEGAGQGSPRSVAAGRGKTPPTGADVAPAPKTRDGTKQARLIAMLRRKEGATIAQIVETTEWQPDYARQPDYAELGWASH